MTEKQAFRAVRLASASKIIFPKDRDVKLLKYVSTQSGLPKV